MESERAKIRPSEAMASLVCAILGIFIVGIILGPVAIALSARAKRKIQEDPELGGGRMARAGRLIGEIETVLYGLIIAGFLMEVWLGVGPFCDPCAHERRYDSDHEVVRRATMWYYSDHGTWPATANITINVSGTLTECRVIDVCRLLDPPGDVEGYLPNVLPSCTEISGADNCDVAGDDGATCSCDPNAHYIWAVNPANGFLYSSCVGADCDANDAHGPQGIYP